MSIQDRLADAQALYEAERPEGALLMLLIAIAATSRKRYPRDQHSDKDAFTQFVQDEQGNITGTVSNVRIENLNLAYNNEMMRFPDLLYSILRNQLVHEATIPDDIRFVRGGTVLMRLGNTLTFNEVFLQGLANVVLLAPECKGEVTRTMRQDDVEPSTLLALLLDSPLDFRRVLTWKPPPSVSKGEILG